jgi:hypothetical protein
VLSTFKPDLQKSAPNHDSITDGERLRPLQHTEQLADQQHSNCEQQQAVKIGNAAGTLEVNMKCCARLQTAWHKRIMHARPGLLSAPPHTPLDPHTLVVDADGSSSFKTHELAHTHTAQHSWMHHGQSHNDAATRVSLAFW